MSEYKLKTPKMIEDAVVGTYKKIENGVVGTYKKIEDKFVHTFLEKAEPPAAGMADDSPSIEAEHEN